MLRAWGYRGQSCVRSAADEAAKARRYHRDVPVADPWSFTAPFYDLDLEGVEDDIDMYRELALRQGGAVLELGCGTGRVAIPLARAGLNVIGVDLSASMLGVARERATGLPVTWVEADMRDVRLRRRFETVLIPFGGLQHMETADDVAAALSSVARHLARDGVAVVDIESPHPEDLEPGAHPLVLHWTRQWQGSTVSKLVAVDGRPSEGVRNVTFHYDVQPAEGGLRRVSHEFVLRVITAGELQLAARLAGLELVAEYGGYDLSPVSDGDDRYIAYFGHTSARDNQTRARSTRSRS
jgi:SAM-dependent methyltransferase